MKRKLLCAILLVTLLGAGCGKPPVFGNNPSTEVAETNTDTDTDKAAEYLTAIASIPVDVKGEYYRDLEKSFTLYLKDGAIEDIQPGYVLASGTLCNDIMATDRSITIKYTLDNTGKINYGFPANSDEKVMFTPAIPFSLDDLCNSGCTIVTEKINSERKYFDLTWENFPDIQFLDDWYDNFSYNGRYLFTEPDGNKWISRDVANIDIYFSAEDGQWVFPDEIFVEAYSEN